VQAENGLAAVCGRARLYCKLQALVSESTADTVQIKAAIPELRKTHGRIILTSSGAALTGYSAWGAYGSSKAAMNHLALTLKVEEPTITTIAIRPGVVDTEMQRELREVYHEKMDKKDKEKFIGAKANGTCKYIPTSPEITRERW
jgi:NAD(P)-dependent dehydrogenase (short-subunit alcohol dehydrogenase family)